MRYTFLHVVPGQERYLSSTAVLIAEVMKLVISLIFCFILDSNMSLEIFTNTLYNEIVMNPRDWMRLCVPSILYTIQNTLQYFSMSMLSAPIFQVLYQMKIITTAIFSVTILGRNITSLQWLSVVALTGGVAVVQLSQMDVEV